MLLLQFHLDQSGFVLALRKNDVVPFVLQFFDFMHMSSLQRLHFLSMAILGLFFALLFFKNAQFFEPLASKGRLLKLTFPLTVLSMFVENLKEILRDEL